MGWASQVPAAAFRDRREWRVVMGLSKTCYPCTPSPGYRVSSLRLSSHSRPRAPQRVQQQPLVLGHRVCTSVSAWGLQELGKKPPCVLARAALSSFSFSWILACLLPQEKKKRSRMFGKICRSVEHFLHWCKRREGSGGGEGEARRCSEGASWPQPPTCWPRHARGTLSGLLPTLDPFSGPATLALEEAPSIPL